MKIDNPYDTSFGSLINTAKISEELTRYLVSADIDSLSYEYSVEGDNKLIFITGYNDEEKLLPLLSLKFAIVENVSKLFTDVLPIVNWSIILPEISDKVSTRLER